MHKSIVSFLLVVSATCTGVAAQFREWALQATDIVVVDAVSQHTPEEQADYKTEPYDYYNLYVRQVIKGELSRSAPVLIRCNDYDILDEDDVYLDEDKPAKQNLRLFFLKKENYGYNHLGSYEELEETDIYFIREKLDALFELVKKDKKTRFYETLQWIVGCSSNKYTASTLSDLSIYSEFFEYYEKEGIIVNKQLPFTLEERTTLKDNIFKLELDYDYLTALEMLYPDFPQEIEDFLIKKINSLDDYDITYFGSYIMETLISANHITGLETYVEKYNDAGARSGAYQKEINNFLKAYKKKRKNG